MLRHVGMAPWPLTPVWKSSLHMHGREDKDLMIRKTNTERHDARGFDLPSSSREREESSLTTT